MFNSVQENQYCKCLVGGDMRLLRHRRKHFRVEAETTVQITRIEADGGTVVDADWMNTVIKTMKTQGIYGIAKFIGDANIAYKDAGSGKVSVLYDISGNDNDALQGSDASRPVWTAAQQNGKAGLVFDGSNDRLSLPIPSSSDYTFLSAFKTSAAELQCLLTLTDNDGITGFKFRLDTDGTFKTFVQGSPDLTLTTPLAYNDNSAHLAILTLSNSATNLYLNSSLKDTDSAFVPTGDWTDNRNMGSDRMQSFLDGNIFFDFIFNSVLTTAQRQAMETIINNYYAIY